MLPELFTRAHSYFLRFVSKTAPTAATTSTYGTFKLGLGALDAPVKRLILCEPNLEYTPGSISHILYGYLVCEKLSGLNCATTLGFRPHVKDPTLSWYLSRFITKTPAAIPATSAYGTLDALGPVERLILCEPNLQYTLGSISHMLHGYLACEKLSGLGCVIAISFRPHVKNPLFTYHIDIHFNYLAALAERNMDTITELPSFAYAGFTPSAHEEIDSTDADVQDIHLSEPIVPRPIHKAPTYPPGLQLPNLARYPITPPPTEPSVGRLYPSRGFRLQWPAGAIAPCPVEVASNEPAPRILEHNGARFKVTGELGSGSFGRVMRAFVLGPGQEELVEVAIKVMNKDYLYRHAEGRDLVLKEKEAMERIMQASSCESGLVGLVKAWCDEENIYFVMPLYHGDIYTLLEQRNLAHPSYAMRYIAAQLIQAIANAHSLGIMHRDIKPPNILISKNGHLVLADFGLAYVAPPGVDLAELGFGVDSLCGTEVYEAPEMILMHIVSDYEHLTHELVPLPESERLRYTCAVDVWAMGLVIYEIVVGSLNPWFHSSSREETRNRILAGSHKAFDWQAVESFDPLLADLLRRMLDYSPRRRITAEEAILHPYFQGIHWDILAEQESQGPIYPVPPPPPCTASSHEYENSFSASDFVVSEEEDRNVRWQRSMDRREPQAHEFACSFERLYDVLGIPREL